MRHYYLSPKSQNLDNSSWYYEEQKGLCIIKENRDKKGRLNYVEQITIPWKMIINSVKRYYKK